MLKEIVRENVMINSGYQLSIGALKFDTESGKYPVALNSGSMPIGVLTGVKRAGVIVSGYIDLFDVDSDIDLDYYTVHMFAGDIKKREGSVYLIDYAELIGITIHPVLLSSIQLS
jgi:hypothetical protein